LRKVISILTWAKESNTKSEQKMQNSNKTKTSQSQNSDFKIFTFTIIKAGKNSQKNVFMYFFFDFLKK